jgi:hypothetical protein
MPIVYYDGDNILCEYYYCDSCKIIIHSADMVKHAHTKTKYTIYTTDPLKYIAARGIWGTKGKDGTEPLSWYFLDELSSEHINNIINTLKRTPARYVAAFKYILSERRSKIINSIVK